MGKCGKTQSWARDRDVLPWPAEVFSRAPRTRDRSEADAMSGEAFLAAHKNDRKILPSELGTAQVKPLTCRTAVTFVETFGFRHEI